jgi:hypothetical protein
MKKGSLFVSSLRSLKPWCLGCSLGTGGKSLMSTSALSWFHNVLTDDEKVIEY